MKSDRLANHESHDFGLGFADLLGGQGAALAPVCDIGRVIVAGLKSKLQIGAQEGGPELSYQFLDCVTFAPEAMPAEVTVEPGLAACPVGVMPKSAY